MTEKSESNGPRGSGEAGEGGGGVFEVQHLGVVILGGIHRLQGGIRIQHVLLGLNPIIPDQGGGYAQPGTVREGADFGLRIGLQLFRDGFDLPGLNIELILEKVDGAEGADLSSKGDGKGKEKNAGKLPEVNFVRINRCRRKTGFCSRNNQSNKTGRTLQ